MLQSDIFNSHVEEYEAWYVKHNEAYLSEVAAIKEQFQKLPENISTIAGYDISYHYKSEKMIAGVVVLQYPSLMEIDKYFYKAVIPGDFQC